MPAVTTLRVGGVSPGAADRARQRLGFRPRRAVEPLGRGCAAMELTKTEILQPDLRSRTPGLAEEFTNAEPFRHVVIPDFFSEEFSRRLMEDFPSFDQEVARNEAGNPGRKAVQSKVRDLSPAFQELDDFIQTSEFLDLISDITGIPDLLYDPE